MALKLFFCLCLLAVLCDAKYVTTRRTFEEACPPGYQCPPAMKCTPSFSCQPQQSPFCQKHGTWQARCVQDIDSPELCSLPLEGGMCLAYFPSWGYNGATNQCEEFVYGGCGGNGNIFRTKDECEKRCQRSATNCDVERHTNQ